MNVVFAIALFLVSGCAMNEAYNPVAASTTGVFELNGPSLRKVNVGMTSTQVHDIMGDSIVIGYTYSASASTPLTLKNPYKKSAAKDTRPNTTGDCVVEYYATAVLVPDGVVSDSELMPLKFCNDVLVSKGWDKLK